MPTAVAETGVQITVIAETEHAGIVVVQNLIDLEQHVFGGSISNIGVGRRDLVPTDMCFDSTLRGHVVDKKRPVLCIVRMKSQPEQTVFSKGRHTAGQFAADIQKSPNLAGGYIRIIREN
ncbi:MAG: hypothetical protein ALAOOOJD_04334 [bacterium]|nr:hypothetical protein [bacterium]